MIQITLPDQSTRDYNSGITPIEVAKDISEGLARQVISASYNDKTIETVTPLNEDGILVLYTWKDNEGKKAFWHSSAHILAQVLEEYYPGVKLTIGPPIERGFYYDVDLGEDTISEKDFQKIEMRMLEIAREKYSFRVRKVSKKDALRYYKTDNNPYKIELIEALDDGTITFCDHANFTDLCRGGHIPNTALVKAVKIINVAGAYWRGNENNKQLTRLYGISFPKQKELTEYLHLIEEAKKRDHRKIGKALDLFTFSSRVGQGLPLWLPKGVILRDTLEQFLKKAQVEAGYEQVLSPHIGEKSLYETSGHYAKYGKDSFQPIHTPNEGEEFLLKPMNCPHHCEIFRAKPWSYKDLPKRYAEFGTVYRYEQSGELHGLTRVRGFTQDDAHIFCTPEQLETEFMAVIDLVLHVFSCLGFDDFKTQVSLRDPDNPSKYIGSDDNWNKAEQAILNATKLKKLDYVIETGEAAFYGPKLDFMVKDALQRSWQLGTIQVDYNLPERFDLQYTGADNKPHRPIMIHRAPFGSLERFIAILLENTAGKLPLWLMPNQVAILSISDKFEKYAQKVLNMLKKHDIRALIDARNETIGKKIREAEIQKTPYMFIIGNNEAESDKVSVRKQGHGDLGQMSVEDFVTIFEREIADSFNKKVQPQD